MFKFMALFVAMLCFVGCLTSQTPTTPDVPRRQYESVPTEGKTISDIFVANQYSKSSLVPTENSKRYSTALFLSDLDMLDTISEADFERFSTAVFSEFPDGEQVKEVVIPSLSGYVQKGDENTPIEKDAYLFIKKAEPQGNIQTYQVETNIPIASIYANDYDGYVMHSNGNFYKDMVPLRWVALANIAYNGSTIIYEGVAFPRRASPLVYTGTGIGPDNIMKGIVSTGAVIDEVISQLDDVVTKATSVLPQEPAQLASILFMKKYAAMSISAYEYINGNSSNSLSRFKEASAISVEIPKDARGSQYGYLERIMRFLLKT